MPRIEFPRFHESHPVCMFGRFDPAEFREANTRRNSMPSTEFPGFKEPCSFFRTMRSYEVCDSSRIRRYTWILDTKEIHTFVQ